MADTTYSSISVYDELLVSANTGSILDGDSADPQIEVIRRDGVRKETENAFSAAGTSIPCSAATASPQRSHNNCGCSDRLKC